MIERRRPGLTTRASFLCQSQRASAPHDSIPRPVGVHYQNFVDRTVRRGSALTVLVSEDLIFIGRPLVLSVGATLSICETKVYDAGLNEALRQIGTGRADDRDGFWLNTSCGSEDSIQIAIKLKRPGLEGLKLSSMAIPSCDFGTCSYVGNMRSE